MPPAAGRCEEGTPCEQGCFNLHDFMYECYCHQGFYLHSNGYNCIGEKMDLINCCIVSRVFILHSVRSLR